MEISTTVGPEDEAREREKEIDTIYRLAIDFVMWCFFQAGYVSTPDWYARGIHSGTCQGGNDIHPFCWKIRFVQLDLMVMVPVVCILDLRIRPNGV